MSISETVELRVLFTPAEGVQIYKDKISFSWEESRDAEAGDPVLPPAATVPDLLAESEDAVVEVYVEPTTVRVPVTVAADAAGTAIVGGRVDYQACTDNLCFPPTKF